MGDAPQPFPLAAALDKERTRRDMLARALSTLDGQARGLGARRRELADRADAARAQRGRMAERLTSTSGTGAEFAVIRDRLDGLVALSGRIDRQISEVDAEIDELGRKRAAAVADLDATSAKVSALEQLEDKHRRGVQRDRDEAEDREREDAALLARLRTPSKGPPDAHGSG